VPAKKYRSSQNTGTLIIEWIEMIGKPKYQLNKNTASKEKK
jgi:hypothetical protein